MNLFGNLLSSHFSLEMIYLVDRINVAVVYEHFGVRPANPGPAQEQKLKTRGLLVIVYILIIVEDMQVVGVFMSA